MLCRPLRSGRRVKKRVGGAEAESEIEGGVTLWGGGLIVDSVLCAKHARNATERRYISVYISVYMYRYMRILSVVLCAKNARKATERRYISVCVSIYVYISVYLSVCIHMYRYRGADSRLSIVRKHARKLQEESRCVCVCVCVCLVVLALVAVLE